MSIRDVKGEVEDLIKVQNVIISVYDKTGLEAFVAGMMAINPNINIISTGGTYNAIKSSLGEGNKRNLVDVADYTEFPEMEGGLVKTLHPKIHAGILAERNNSEHQKYLNETLQDGHYIDLVVVNLYPFQEIVAKADISFETARGHIDIGGPTMLRAAAKNFLGCAAVCDPADYRMLLEELRETYGCTTFNTRLNLAKKVFKLTRKYDYAIAEYFMDQISSNLEEIRQGYGFGEVDQNGK